MQSQFAAARILVVGAKGHAGPLMRTILTAAGVGHIVLIQEPRRALELLCAECFEAVFVEGATQLEDSPFAVVARRTPDLVNPLVPIFAVFANVRRRDVERARDLGVTDVICRPVSPKTVSVKLHAALLAPRPFIAAPDFFGPDRRAKPRPWRGADRRARIPRKAKIAAPH